MKKIILGVGALAIFGGGYLVGNIDNQKTVEATPQAKKEINQVIETEKAKIEYFDVANGDFDVIITPKGNRNVTAEWDIKSGDHYKDCYIVGQKKENAELLWKNHHSKYGVEWTWDK